MARKFAYYPGCVAEFSSKELDATTKALAPMIDIELLPMPAAPQQPLFSQPQPLDPSQFVMPVAPQRPVLRSFARTRGS